MNKCNLINKITSKELDSTFETLYGSQNIKRQKNRYIEAINGFCDYFNDSDDLFIFSAPGRTEIGGNHTDHNMGKVLAASISVDIIAVVSFNKSEIIRLKSVGYEEDTLNINKTDKNKSEEGKSVSLIRGILAGLKKRGYKFGGFNAYTTSDVLSGSGLSSSAAFEILVSTILNCKYNDGIITPVEIAKISQYAEFEYFAKPCGLMDQMASSVGGIVSIDFKDESNPVIEKVDFDINKAGYSLCIVDTNSSHADLTDEYSLIPSQMKMIASYFGKPNLRQIEKQMVIDNIKTLRNQFGDRAVLRALHYFNENERVDNEVIALKNNDFESFKKLIIKSGDSSYKYLQNIYSNKQGENQGLSLALYIAQNELENVGAYRVHGGGFAGTTQNFVPSLKVDTFKEKIESAFCKNSCHIINIRSVGGVQVTF
ncbi:MAG: galactokinase family protein [Oscillospiraceae bacterium]